MFTVSLATIHGSMAKTPWIVQPWFCVAVAKCWHTRRATSMKQRAPAFQFYPRQFAGDDQLMGMDLEAVGAHILLMD